MLNPYIVFLFDRVQQLGLRNKTDQTKSNQTRASNLDLRSRRRSKAAPARCSAATSACAGSTCTARTWRGRSGRCSRRSAKFGKLLMVIDTISIFHSCDVLCCFYLLMWVFFLCEDGKPIPTELRNEEAALRKEIDFDDEMTEGNIFFLVCFFSFWF